MNSKKELKKMLKKVLKDIDDNVKDDSGISVVIIQYRTQEKKYIADVHLRRNFGELRGARQ